MADTHDETFRNAATHDQPRRLYKEEKHWHKDKTETEQFCMTVDIEEHILALKLSLHLGLKLEFSYISWGLTPSTLCVATFLTLKLTEVFLQ